jgi:signal transduction histidine kinase
MRFYEWQDSCCRQATTTLSTIAASDGSRSYFEQVDRVSILKRNAKRFQHVLARILIAGVVLISLTVISRLLHSNLATAGLLYIVVVVLLSRVGDLLSSIVTSIMAALCLAYLAPPPYAFRVADPFDVVAIVVFLMTSLVITTLVSKLRNIAEVALSSVDRRVIDAEERERGRIAKVLHDDIEQRMAFLKVTFEQFKLNISDPSVEVLVQTDQLLEQISALCADIHTLAHSSHIRKLEYLGLVKTARSFCKEFGLLQKVEIEFTGRDLPSPLRQDISLSLFRVLQEALQNSAKHSGARQLQVELFELSDAVHLIVRDSGLGFDPKVAKNGGGLGLVCMQERIKLVKGALSISTQLDRGTTIHAWVPLSSEGSLSHTATRLKR